MGGDWLATAGDRCWREICFTDPIAG